jgi:hypothetical protein
MARKRKTVRSGAVGVNKETPASEDAPTTQIPTTPRRSGRLKSQDDVPGEFDRLRCESTTVTSATAKSTPATDKRTYHEVVAGSKTPISTGNEVPAPLVVRH